MSGSADIGRRVNCVVKIDRISCNITYAEFFEKFIFPNIPCIIQDEITKSWLSRKLWVCGNKPNFHYLREKFGTLVAPVANCEESYHGSQKKSDIRISEFLSYWEEYILKSYPVDMPILYLKDWHLKREFPDSCYYEVPLYFGSDWLNEFWSERNDICDDFRFVYMGPKGSWTPDHIDVFSSYSWSANIVGRKKWRFYPPEEYSLFAADQEALGERKVIEIIQESGEIIFVPSGWRHEVFNLEDTISINHNWVNACNVENWMWPALNSALNAVEVELEDCLREGMEAWEEQCQLVLRAMHGIDFLQFYAFLRALAERRVHFLLTIDLFSNIDALIQQRGTNGNEINASQSVEKVRLNSASIDTYLNFEVAKEEPLKLCYDHKPLKVVSYKYSNSFLYQKVIELKFEAGGKKEEVAMLCENGWWLGMLHAFYDVCKIQKVMESLLSQPCVLKLEFFKKLTNSESHRQLMQKLDYLIHHREAVDLLKQLNRFSR